MPQPKGWLHYFTAYMLLNICYVPDPMLVTQNKSFEQGRHHVCLHRANSLVREINKY